MTLDVLLSAVLLVSFLVTIILAVGSYLAYKVRERRWGPRDEPAPAPSHFYERVTDLDEPDRHPVPRAIDGA